MQSFDQYADKQQLRAKIEEYLLRQNLPLNKAFRCLSPLHEDKNPSMSYDKNRQRVHCFACGVDYDIFDLIGLEYGISGWKEIYTRVQELYGSGVSPPQGASRLVKSEPENVKAPEKEKQQDFTAYFANCRSRLAKTAYHTGRGLSGETCARFGLGFDPEFNWGTGGKKWEALVVPTGKHSFLARNTDPSAPPQQRVRKRGGGGLFNTAALMESTGPVFVVEGEIDALSIEECGYPAVGLGSTANVQALLNFIQGRQDGAGQELPVLLLALDNDGPGRAASLALCGGLEKLGVQFFSVDPYGTAKDANQALVEGRDAFCAALAAAADARQAAEQAQREAYRKNNVAAHLPDFLDGISSGAATEYIPTGYTGLDTMLDGGLYEGLYLLGGISSLGKTSLALQMADQMAEGGQDVLFFSLEMARTELMAKSISRMTVLDCLEHGLDTCHAKTARGITTGSRWAGYPETDHEVISRAVAAYGRCAENLYIIEGIGDIGTADIRRTVEDHIRFTGSRPVVFIDYVQILAPWSDRATDKQNADRAILELKRISRDFKLPVIGMSSFNRANYSQQVTMEAFKESGGLEYSSDVLFGLQLKGAGSMGFDPNEAKRRTPREIELKVLKNRNGITGETISFKYHPMFNLFSEV